MATKVGEDNTLGLRGKKIGDEYVGISVEDRLQVPIALQKILEACRK